MTFQAEKLIIDGRNLLYRTADAFVDLSAEVNGETMGTGGMYGFLSCLIKIHSRYGGDVYVAWEGKRSRNFRRALYPDYKKRSEPDEEKLAFLADMAKQEIRLRALLRALGVRQYQGGDCEADDVMAWLACSDEAPGYGARTLLYTGDSDLRALVHDGSILVASHGRGGDTLYDESAVREKHGVPASLLPHQKALAGDTSDGIPGLAGIGAKTASALLLEHGDLHGVIKAAKGDSWSSTKRHRERVLADADKALLYLSLTTLRIGAKVIEIPVELDIPRARKYLGLYKFRSLMLASEFARLKHMGEYALL